MNVEPDASNADTLVGALIAGRYRVLRKLGEGGMGIVYEAEQQPLQRHVALKVLAPNSDAEDRERFVREARAASRLHHPNIATVYDFGHAESGPFLAMELIEGKTIRELLVPGEPMNWERAHTLATQVARGLAAAHHLGIVHRDIKPANLIVQKSADQEQVKILDFGLANLVGNTSSSLTRSGFVMGTAGYISPEQIDGVTTDVRSDVYALGVILYEMLAGGHPFYATTPTALAIAHATERPCPLAERAPDVPEALCDLVDRLLSKTPADRPADAGELVSALSAVISPLSTAAMASGTGSRRHGLIDDRAPRGMVTLVFTDIEGSTALWEREPRGMRLALDLHNSAMRHALEAHDGYEVKTQGDSFMVAFTSEINAVSWCLAVQRSLREQEWPSEILRILHELTSLHEVTSLTEVTPSATFDSNLGLRVRMGVHVGTPECRRGPVTGRMDYFGPVVNRAARIESAAHGGQILVSAAVAKSVREHLDPEDARLLPMGDHMLRGLKTSEVLTAIIDVHSPTQELSAPRAPTVQPTSNIVSDHSLFVGRQDELKRIDEAFAAGARLVTLLGPGGTGKTRLSRVTACLQMEKTEGPIEVWFCDLSATTNGTALVATVANVLSVPLAGGAGVSDAAELVGRSLTRRGHVFLVLDNVEQILEPAAEALSTWLRANPKLRVLATSREPLNIAGEQRLELEPLDLEGGVKLFEARVREMGHSVDGAPEVVRELVLALDGVPLAIELAASRIGLMKPKQILDRLSSRFELLRGSRRGVAARQATLRGAIDWSWDLLSEVERVAFAQLAAFEGGFSIEAAEEVIDLSAFAEAPFALDVVQALKDKSLLRASASTSPDPTLRLGMLQSIQHYAQSKLAESEGQDAAYARHAAYFVREGRRNAAATSTAEKLEAVTWLASNRQNLFAVCERFGDSRPALAVASSLALQPLLAERDPTEPHRNHLRSAIGWARAAGDDIPLAELLLHRANLELEKGDADSALALVTEAHALVGETRAPILRATALAESSRILHRLGRFEEGAAALDKAEPLARAHGAHSVLARILSQRGLLALSTISESQDYLRDALRLARRSGDRSMEARILGNIGVEHMVRGRLLEAEAAMLDALELHRSHGARSQEGLTMGNIGTVVLALGNGESSETWLREAIAIHRELGNTFLEAADLSNLARTLVELSRIHEAIAHATSALQQIEETRGARERLICQCNLTIAYACIDDVPAAKQTLELARSATSFWQTQKNLLNLAEAHVDFASARADGAPLDDERVTRANETLRHLLQQRDRLFLPLQSLVRTAKHYPNQAPVLDSAVTTSHC